LAASFCACRGFLRFTFFFLKFGKNLSSGCRQRYVSQLMMGPSDRDVGADYPVTNS
jgi:hypothetical protein